MSIFGIELACFEFETPLLTLVDATGSQTPKTVRPGRVLSFLRPPPPPPHGLELETSGSAVMCYDSRRPRASSWAAARVHSTATTCSIACSTAECAIRTLLWARTTSSRAPARNVTSVPTPS